MVGLRVFDVGALIVWLVWFFKLRDDDDDAGGDDDAAGGGPRNRPTGGGGGLTFPLPDAQPWPKRRRDHGGDRSPARAAHRPPSAAPSPPHRATDLAQHRATAWRAVRLTPDLRFDLIRGSLQEVPWPAGRPIPSFYPVPGARRRGARRRRSPTS